MFVDPREIISLKEQKSSCLNLKEQLIPEKYPKKSKTLQEQQELENMGKLFIPIFSNSCCSCRVFDFFGYFSGISCSFKFRHELFCSFNDIISLGSTNILYLFYFYL